jgi:hypothetical protein
MMNGVCHHKINWTPLFFPSRMPAFMDAFYIKTFKKGNP